MATGAPKTRWNSERLATSASAISENTPAVNLSYEGKRAEYDILKTEPVSTQVLWKGSAEQADEQVPNRLYYGDNLPILASLLQDPAIRGKVRLIY